MQVTRLYTILLVSFLFSTAADSLEAQAITYVPLYTFDGDNPNDRFGISVSGAGDVNGDSTPDLIVGRGGEDKFGPPSGSVRVFSGSDGSVLHTFNGDTPNELFGSSVSGAGDVNGDGRDDLIVGSPDDGDGSTGSGSARVLSGIDGSVLYKFDGDNRFDALGHSVSGTGDVNGDGTPDLIVGAVFDDNNGNSSGSARVLSGNDGSVLYSFDGVSDGDNFGFSVSGAGDVNGDGTPDLIVGARFDDNNGFRSGSARVLSGSDGTVLFTFNGDSANELFGSSVSGAGDVNGDGRDDLIVGAFGDDNNGNLSGSARVLSGSDGSVLYSFNGDSTADFFGFSVSGAGDVNGDGKADLIVGALHEDNNGSSSGSAFVLSGSDGSVLYTFDGDSVGDEFGASVSGAGDINGDGINDFIIGAPNGGANGDGYARVFVSQIVELGDVNHDGVVNFLDISPFISFLSGDVFLAEADVNEDGLVNFLDISPFIAILSGQ